MSISSQAVADCLLASISASKRSDSPYKHWFMTSCLPDDAIDTILSLPFHAWPWVVGRAGC